MLGTLRLKLFAVLLLPLLVGVLLAGVASYNFLQSSYLTLLEDRLQVLANDIGDVAEANDSIGQPLIALTTMQALLEREKAENGDIAAIAAFLENGRIVFDTDRMTIGDTIPRAWLPDGRLATENWSRITREELIVGSPIINSFRRPIGGVVVRVSANLVGIRKVEAFRTVASIGLGFLLLGAAAAFVAVGQLAGQLARPIARAVRDIDAAAELVRADTPATTPPATTPPDSAGGRAEAVVVGRISTLIAPLHAAEKALQQMDEAA